MVQYEFNKDYVGQNKQGVLVKSKMPPIMANSKDGQNHKDKWFFFNWSIIKVKGYVPTEKSYMYNKEYSCEISKLQHSLLKSY